jgi:DNA-binding NarL/FixJ family response regulator
LNNGARGFISKSSDPVHIVNAIHAVHKGKIYLSDDLLSRQYDNTLTKESEAIKQLSSKEFEVFKMLAEGKSIPECAKILCLSEKTVNNYQTAIRSKLKAETPAVLVHFAQRHGVIKSFQ